MLKGLVYSLGADFLPSDFIVSYSYPVPEYKFGRNEKVSAHRAE